MTEKNLPDNISFGKLAETSPIAITKVDKEGNFVYANSKAEDVLGLEKSEIQNRTYNDPNWKITDFEGNEFPEEELPFQQVKNTKESVSDVRFAIERDSGERRFLSTNASPLFDEDGNFDGMVAILEDITERKQVEKDLQTSEQRYKRLFETAQDGMLILNAGTGKIKDANPYIRDLLGFSKEELVGKQLWEIGTFRDLVENKEKFEKLVEEGYVRYKHLPLETKSGEEASVEFVSNSYMVNGQKVVQCNIRDITERRKAERKLKKNERKYRSLFNSIRDAILVADLDRKIIDCNPAFTDLFGYELEEIKGKNTEYVYHDKDEYEEMGEEIQESIGDPNFFYTIHYEKKNGEVFPGETNVFYLQDDEGEVVGFIGLIRDVTERLERRRKLKRSEKRYRTVFENTGTAMLIVEEDTTVSLVNKEVERLTGYSKTEMEGNMSWTELVAREEKLEEMKEYHYRRREDPDSAPNQYEFKLQKKDESLRDVLLTIDVIPDTKKSVASLLDITDRKKAENKLRESEKKFRSYVENAPIGVFLVDDEGNYIEVNEAACEMTGYSEEELLDMQVPDLHPPQKVEEVREAFSALLETGRMNADLPYLRKDETEGYFVINAVKISEGRYLGFTLDVTERKEAQQQLEQATLGTLQALNRTIEAKDEYTGEHIDRVQNLSVELGKKLGLSEERLEQLRYASILHDIGKIGIPDSILGKEGKLTEEEWEEMEKHPEIGERIVSQIDQLKRAAEIIGQHQEKYDGSGYPKGLEGEEITLEARIVAVADAWDAMRTDRPYRDALPKKEALKELRENAGTQFDPEIVDLVLEMLESGEAEFEKE